MSTTRPTPLELGVAAIKEAIDEDLGQCFDAGQRIHEAFLLVAAFFGLDMNDLLEAARMDALDQRRARGLADQHAAVEREAVDLGPECEE